MERLDVSVRKAFQRDFLSALEDGRAKPLLLPYSVIGAFVLPALWLTIPHASRPWVYQTRWPVMAFVVWFNAHIASTTSSTNFACSYAAGLMAMWGVILSLNVLIWRRPQFDVARIRKVPRRPALVNGNGNGVASGTSSEQGGLRRRQLDSQSKRILSGNGESHRDGAFVYIWEPYPADKPWLERLGWVIDLLTSFRGAGTPETNTPLRIYRTKLTTARLELVYRLDSQTR